jgi:hypothetical protein
MKNNVRLLSISEDFLLSLFSAGEHRSYSIIKDAVPSDARFLNVRHGWPIARGEELSRGEQILRMLGAGVAV